ncbi:hypothetical protein cand_022400 [Cryptosporidium andersoni]|uniref:Uncharacterized protein n=1 Tax=Cryptosporidium andersoni TaxID=117008 RepID=A0A1J4MRL9_9CRYT|nr:hypothetical protein cand_022400 [Cryptosporidium andersoni]
MPQKFRGQTIQLRALQRLAYESSENNDNVLPSQSLGLDRPDSQFKEYQDRNLKGKYSDEERKRKEDALDMSRRRGGDEEGRKHKTNVDMDEFITNTNWRSNTGEHSEKTSNQNDLKKEDEISRTPWRSSGIKTNEISTNWRDAQLSGTNISNTTFGSFKFRKETKSEFIDDRPDYLKNRFKKAANLDIAKSNYITSNSSLQRNKDTMETVLKNPNKNVILEQTQSTSRMQTKPQSKSINITSKVKEMSKYEKLESILEKWNINNPEVIDSFERSVWRCILGYEPKQAATPSQFYSKGTFPIPSNESVEAMIAKWNEILDSSDFEKLLLCVKYCHVLVMASTCIRDYSDLKLLIETLKPSINYLVERCSSVEDETILLYILIETQRAAEAIGLPKLDNCTSLLEALWLALYQTKLIDEVIFNKWLYDANLFTEQSKVGRKNALFEVSLLLISCHC